MALHLAFLLFGGVFLYFGAEALVNGAAGLARAFGVSALAIGLTVVAYGTSAPELVVSLLAALDGKSAIALGNVVGSNIANIGLILGLTAIISPPLVGATLIRREIPLLIAAAVLIPVVLYGGRIGRIEGALLLLGAFGFTLFALKTAKEPTPVDEALRHEIREEVREEAVSGSRAKLAGLVVIGLAGLVGGGKLFVDGATGLALSLGISERVVGLTVVAIGTSIPELAASVVAALRGHAAIAVGNVIGSNIFNVLLILGAASVAQPIEGDLAAMRLDLGALFGMTIAAAAFMRTRRHITRLEGAILVAGYVAFLAALAV